MRPAFFEARGPGTTVSPLIRPRETSASRTESLCRVALRGRVGLRLFQEVWKRADRH